MRMLLISSGRGRENSLGNASLENLGLGYIASHFRTMGWQVDVIDLAFNPISDEELLELHYQKHYMAVGISSMTWSADEAIATAKVFRNRRIASDWDAMEAKLYAGGPGPTSMPEYYAPHFDHVIVGEGERALYNTISPLSVDPGSTEREAAPAIVYAERDIRWNGKCSPWHDPELRGILHMRGTFPMAMSEQWPASISGSRGCPNACTFCLSEAMWGRRVAFRPVKMFADEIEHLVNEGHNCFDFTDLNLNLDPEWLINLCVEIIRRGTHKKAMFGGLWNPAIMHRQEEVIAACSEAGFVMLSIGLENPDPVIRDSMDKQKMQTESCHKVFELCLKYGITSRCLVILGSPGQDEKNVEAIQQELFSIKASEVRCSMHTIFPRTKDWDKHQDLLITRDWKLFDTAHQVLASPLGDVEAVRLDLLRSFYNSAAYRTNRCELIRKNPAFKVGYKQLENGFLGNYALIDHANCLGKVDHGPSSAIGHEWRSGHEWPDARFE